MTAEPRLGARARTGMPGLDEILHGGLQRGHTYLVEGTPGTGKTTLGLQFLLAGAARGESALLVTHSESAAEIRAISAAHGWDVGGVEVMEWEPAGRAGDEYTLFHAGEVELGETMARLIDAIGRRRPRRLVFDSLVGLQTLTGSEAVYRRQLQTLRRHLAGSACTAILLDDSPHGDPRAETLVHGVIKVERVLQEFGAERRRLRVMKMRGSDFADGYHDFVVRRGGLAVFPRLVAARSTRRDRDGGRATAMDTFTTGSHELDQLLGGGLTRGTSTLVAGPAGSGKSTLVASLALTAAGRGERACVWISDEVERTWVERMKGAGSDPRPHIAAGTLELSRMDPAEVTPGQLSNALERAVCCGARTVVIDSLNGYVQAMAEERHVAMHMRQLLTFLNEEDVTTLLTLGVGSAFGASRGTAVDVGYMADAILLLRQVEAMGHARHAISVLKKRTGGHEHVTRAFEIGPGGLAIGPPLVAQAAPPAAWPRHHGAADPLGLAAGHDV